ARAPRPGRSGPRRSGPDHVDVATAAAHGRHAPDQMTDKTVGVRALTNWNATKEEHRTEARARSGPNEGHERATNTNTPDTYMFGATSADANRRDDPRRS
ncbi:MAG: hypothetical protein OXG35_13445, partial [Acidobacteria bacterium]|nr:hypothetical protein [Acidobacteriota bacterium]